MEKTDKSAEDHKRWVINTIIKINPSITKGEAESAYDFAEIILGEPVCSPDDTIITGFLAGTKFAAQQLSEYKEVIKELLPLAQNFASTLRWDEEYSGDEVGGKEAQEIVDRAKKLIEP